MAEPQETSALEKQLVTYAKYGAPVVFVLGAAIAGARVGAPGAVLVLAAGALLGVIAAFWSSLRTLFGETPLSGADAYALGAPRAEEEQKRAVLRALKDLEFERSVGKISEEDYQQLVTKYRLDAKRLLRALDEESAPRRDAVEAIVARRLRKEGLLDEPARDESAPDASKTAVKPKKKKSTSVDRAARKAKVPVVEASATHPVACEACGTVNDPDAVFCKKCGARRESPAKEDVSDMKRDSEASEES